MCICIYLHMHVYIYIYPNGRSGQQIPSLCLQVSSDSTKCVGTSSDFLYSGRPLAPWVFSEVVISQSTLAHLLLLCTLWEAIGSPWSSWGSLWDRWIAPGSHLVCLERSLGVPWVHFEDPWIHFRTLWAAQTLLVMKARALQELASSKGGKSTLGPLGEVLPRWTAHRGKMAVLWPTAVTKVISRASKGSYTFDIYRLHDRCTGNFTGGLGPCTSAPAHLRMLEGKLRAAADLKNLPLPPARLSTGICSTADLVLVIQGSTGSPPGTPWGFRLGLYLFWVGFGTPLAVTFEGWIQVFDIGCRNWIWD